MLVIHFTQQILIILNNSFMLQIPKAAQVMCLKEEQFKTCNNRFVKHECFLIFALSLATQNQQTPFSCLIGSRLLQLVFHSPFSCIHVNPRKRYIKNIIKNETILSPEALSNEVFIRNTISHKKEISQFAAEHWALEYWHSMGNSLDCLVVGLPL